MKKYLLVLLSTFMVLDLIAWEYNPCNDIKDVISAYNYKNLGFFYYVPLFKPSTVSRGCNHLQISSYPAETYYGKPVKAAEHPNETVHASYDSKGNLIKILRNDDDFQFQYNVDGVLVGFKQYNINSGKLIKDVQWGIRISKSDGEYFLVENHGKYWYILRPDGHVDGSGRYGGYTVTFDKAFEHSSRGNDMTVIERGTVFCSSSWLKVHAPYWKKEHKSYFTQTAILEKESPDEWTNSYSSRYIFNGIGLLKSNGISPSDVLSQGVYKDTIYEYQWM